MEKTSKPSRDMVEEKSKDLAQSPSGALRKSQSGIGGCDGRKNLLA